jgi:hypothetical protein
MEITVNDTKYVREVQEDFQKRFPFLKIEFFKNTVDRSGSALKSQTIPGRTPIGMIRQIHTEGAINVNGSRSVEDLENDFQNKFGLSVQVLRKSANMWIETTFTHHWSLLRQNYEGQQLS